MSSVMKPAVFVGFDWRVGCGGDASGELFDQALRSGEGMAGVVGFGGTDNRKRDELAPVDFVGVVGGWGGGRL